MGRVQVFDLHAMAPRPVDEVAFYLQTVLHRFSNGIHAEARVYTCRSWRAPAATKPYELHWNDDEVPGESFLGSFGSAPSRDLLAKVRAELDRGEAIWLFLFNSDADLCFQEVLAPVAASRSLG